MNMVKSDCYDEMLRAVLEINLLFLRRGARMVVSYNGLWKLLIDKNMKRMDLAEQAGISTSTIAKMGRGELVSMEVLGRICEKLDCDFGDLVSYEGNNGSEEQRQ